MNEIQNPRPEGAQAEKPLASPPLGEPRDTGRKPMLTDKEVSGLAQLWGKNPPPNEAQERAMRASLREIALIEVMRRYNLTLPANAIQWRVPPQPVAGYIKGISLGELKLLCTDGIVAWFSNSNDSTFFGHMQHFEPNPSDRPAFIAFRSNKGPNLKTKKITALTEED